MKHVGLWPLLNGFEHKFNDLFNKMFFFKKKLYPCSFLFTSSCGSHHEFLDGGLLLIAELLKQGFPVAKLKSSLYLYHKWPHQCSVWCSETFKFARLVPSWDVRYDFHVKSMFDSGHVLFMSFLFIFAYWCPTRFHVVHDLLTPPEHPCFVVGSCCSIISFLYNVLWVIVCPFCDFSLVLCLVFPSLIYGFWLPPLVCSSCSHLNMWCSPSKKIKKRFNIKLNML